MNINKSLGMRRLQAWDGTGLEDIKSIDKIEETSLPYFGVKLSCVCLMFPYRKKSNDL